MPAYPPETRSPARAVSLILVLLTMVAFLVPLPEVAAQGSEDLPAGVFDALTWRHIGPVGNRVSAVTGVPGDPNVYYFGAASGGVFKSVDAGIHWQPVFDDQPAASIGALAIAPSDPNVVWAGTGETFIRSNVSIGNGIYRSTDGGEHWEHRGLDMTGRIGRIIVHPDDPDRVWVAAMGSCYGPQQERGVFRTTDGGQSWERVLFVDENTGASDIIIDPHNPRILFAGMWQMQIWTWGRESGGPGSGLWTSRDGGDTWTELTGRGLPAKPWGKVGLTVSPDDPDRIYALIETSSNEDFAPYDRFQGVLWRSDDGGERWRMVNRDHSLSQRPCYYNRVLVAPDDRDTIHFMSTRHRISYDGGHTTESGNAGGDNHDMWIDPQIPDRMIVGHDGGVSISTTRGELWWRPRLPIAQMYHVYTDSNVPYYVMGNRQDGGSNRGPSNSLTGGSIPIGAWHSVGGCESGFAVPDPVDPNIIWSGCYEGILDRHDLRTGHSRTVSVWPDNPEGWAAADLRYRFQWTFPVAISPHDHERVYAGSQHVHLTTDGGQSWQVISPDLTLNDESRMQKSGGLTFEDVSPTYACVLFALAESPLEEGVIWAGSNDGLVHVTRDGGGTWTNVTANIPDLPEWGTISNIEPSRHAPGTAYLTVDRHQLNDTAPYVYRTTDYGRRWRSLGDGIPRSVFSYAHCVREDPVRPGLLYLGTENAVYVSFDDGGEWHELQSNLPHAPVHWLTIPEHVNDLVIATYGRGFWIMDNITALQQLEPEVVQEDVWLFAPRPAYRFLMRAGSQSQPEDSGAGANPRYGASIDFWLREDPSDRVEVVVLDAAGETVRELSAPGSAGAGLNRVWWDLRLESSNTPKLRMPPLGYGPVEFNEAGWRPLGEGGRVTPLAEPGTYTVKMMIGDREFTRPLTVLKDPNSAGDEARIAEQVQVLKDIRADVNAVVELIDALEWLRKQIDVCNTRLADIDGTQDLIAAGRELDGKLRELEMMLFDLHLTGGNARQDTIRWPRRLYAKLTSLAGYIGGTDQRPTDQQREVYALYRQQLAQYQAWFDRLAADEVGAYNRLLAANGYEGIIIGRER